MRFAFTALLAATLFSTCAAATGVDILPTAKPVNARVMQLGVTRQIAGITDRFSAAVARQPEWFVAYVKEHQNAKGAIPYHANMGISRDEYRKMVESSTSMKLMQTGTVKLSVTRQADGGLRVQTAPPMPGLDGIVIEPGGQGVKTRYARLAEPSQVDNRNANGPTGRWSGTQWEHKARTDTHSLAVTLALGKRPEHGDGILYLDVRDVGEGKKDIFYEILLFPVGR
ncbi:hypothetical protein OU994_29325 [Pseudoduganella sp. SL102]|uniref:hypothetical protein n=1 Tax=Pseudoduganella sp. SL102 TaxID=2995154 RepID=UPI00248C0301|nr:hypothetical protein [Pseudoduganella sp. SL102]WBS02299.1 hypothetical protein OU994_29325 [Pseudoduganella sp. SL102]